MMSPYLDMKYCFREYMNLFYCIYFFILLMYFGAIAGPLNRAVSQGRSTEKQQYMWRFYRDDVLSE